MKTRLRVALVIVLGIGAAALPGLVWHLLHRGDPASPPAEEAEVPAADPGEQVAELRRSTTVERTDLEIGVPGDRLLVIRRLSRQPGEAAQATGTTLSLPALWTQRSGQLGREISGFWDRLPEDCDTVRDAAARVEVGLRTPGGAPLVLEKAELTLRRTPGGLAVGILSSLEDGASLSVELERVEATGGVHLTVTAGGRWPVAPPWLPQGWSLRFGRVDVMGTAGLVLQDLQVTDAAGEGVLRSNRLVVEGREAVPLAMLRDGLPGRELVSARGLTITGSDLMLRWPQASQLPLFQELEGLATAGSGELEVVTLSAGGAPLRMEGLSFKAASRVMARAGALELEADGATVVRDVKVTPGWWNLEGTVPLLRIVRDAYGVVDWRLDGASIRVAPGPADMIRATLWASTTMGRLRAILAPPAAEAGDAGKAPMAPSDLLPDTRPLLEALKDRTVHGEGCTLKIVAGPADITFNDLSLSAGWQHASALALRFAAGGVEGTEGLAGPFELAADFDPAGTLALLRARLGGEKLSSLVRRVVPGQSLREGRLELDLSWTASGEGAVFQGWVQGRDLLLEHRRLAGWPIRVPELRVEVKGAWHDREDRLRLDLVRASLGEAWARGSIVVGALHGVRSYQVSLDVPEQDCGVLFRSIPGELVPHLSDAVFQGSLSAHLSFVVDLGDVRGTLKFDVGGDFDRCRAVTMGRLADVEALKREDYVHRVVVKGEDIGIVVGPASGSYSRLERIPGYVQAAAWGTEDLGFFEHRGFKLSLIRRALILLFERGYFAYGGSTVSQQLVKNLFLYRDKTASRKLEEAIITWQMEKALSKERILELYLNCIEFGPRIWGIKRAARVYFGKAPDELSPLEAAFIMANKPDPPYGYYMFHRGKVNDRWKVKLKRVMDRLHFQMGVITEAQYQA
ncbi:MAG: transglycosylase domain-containing protein, partial [Deltaproteobacteria bacterium]|nr:transglycosylase domain-containing protein [Deltaproteobacteria bacterium]